MRALKILVVMLPALGLGCSSHEEENANEDPQASKAQSAPPPTEPPPQPETKAPPAAEDDNPWDADAEPPAAPPDGEPTADSDLDPDPLAEPLAEKGPCTIRWSNGAILKFAYTEQGGSVRLDHDHDGKADACATYELDGARLRKLELDEACDGKDVSTLAPTYDDTVNLATAKSGGKGSEVTIVTLPSFVGLEPGYTLHAKKSAIKISIKEKRVTKARVAKPSEGAPLEATFTYDDAGRIVAIEEDLDLNRSIDRKLTYAYDTVGRMSRIEVTYGTPDEPQKSTARIDYSCHEKPDGG